MSDGAARWFIWVGVASQVVGLLMVRFDLGRHIPPPPSGDLGRGRERSPSIGFVVAPLLAQIPALDAPVGRERDGARTVAVDRDPATPVGDAALGEWRHRHQRAAAARDREERSLRCLWRGLAITAAGVLVTAVSAMTSVPS